MRILGLLVGLAVVVSAAPGRASSVIHESAAANLTVTSTFAGLTTYVDAYEPHADSQCIISDVEISVRGCGFGRAYSDDAGEGSLALSTDVWFDFVPPEAPGWASAQMLQVVDPWGYMSWWNETEVEQTLSWTVAYELSVISSPYNLANFGASASLKIDGYKYSPETGEEVRVPGCTDVQRHGPGAGIILGCSLTLAPGESLDLYITMHAKTYLDVAEADVAPVPLPASAFLLLAGLGLVAGARARRFS